MAIMKLITLVIFLIFGFQIAAQDAELQSKIDIFNSKIQQTEKGERLRWMDSLSATIYLNGLYNNSKFKYDSITRQTIKYAIALDSLDMAADHVADLLWYNTYGVRKPEEGILLFNTYINDFKTIENNHTLARLYFYVGVSYEATGDLEKPLECYIKVKDYSIKSGNDSYLGLANQYIGHEESNLGKFSEASISYKTAIGLFIKVKDTTSIINTKNSLANLYSVNAFHEEALIERNEAIELAKNGITSIGLVALYNGASQDYKITGNPEKQIEYLKVGLDLLKTMPTRPRVAYEKLKLLADLSNAYVDSDSLERAEQTFKVLEALYIKDESGRNRRDYINARKTLAYAKGNYQEALEYSNVYLEIQTERKNIVGIMNAEKSLSEVFKALGNTSNSNTHLLNHYRIKDSISSVQNVKSLAYYQTLYETEKRDLEIIKQGLEIKQLESDKVIESGKKNIRYTILISSLLLMAGVTYYLLERAKRKRKIIAEKLMRSKKELNDFTQQLLVKSKEQDVLKKEFNSLKSLYGEKEELVELQELADSKILTNEDWDNFKLKFKSVYAHFFINFKNNGFKFSDSEERLVALEKLSLKTNEIANMLGISPDSVHTARYRLRKKLNIPKNIDIIEFLNL
jgi:tetratricopeptide (TPR) repeat protein/DNA-binding CsgD family transcriptional regulator